MSLPAGARFERRYDPAAITVPNARVYLGPAVFDASGETLLSLAFGLAQRGSYAHSVLAEGIEVVGADGTTRGASVVFVAESPRNGGGPIHPEEGGYHLRRMGPGLIDEVVLRFEPPLTAAVQSVRVRVDGVVVDIPLRFGPPTRAEVPEVATGVAAACQPLVRCCAGLPPGETRRACTDWLESAQRLGLPEECVRGAAAYCPP